MPTVNYLWDPIEDNIIEEYDDDGNTIAEYTTEPGYHGAVISEHRDGQTYYHLRDGQGNTVALTNDQGEVTDTFAYTAGGELTERTGTTPTPYQYKSEHGYYTDQTTGQIMVRRRELDPSQGRWLSVDRLQFFDSTNHYWYVSNRPTILFDPSGLTAEISSLGSGIGTGLGFLGGCLLLVPPKCCVKDVMVCTTTPKNPILEPGRDAGTTHVLEDHAYRIRFTSRWLDTDCRCDCCVVEQWASGYYRVYDAAGNLISDRPAPLPGSGGKPIDPKVMQQDSPREKADPCQVFYWDSPGSGLGGSAWDRGYILDVNLSFELRVIDVCGAAEAVIQTKAFKVQIKGPISKGKLKVVTDLPECNKNFLKELDEAVERRRERIKEEEEKNRKLPKIK